MKKIITLILVSLFLMNCEGSESTIQTYTVAHSYNISINTELNYTYPNKPHYEPYNIKFNNNY